MLLQGRSAGDEAFEPPEFRGLVFHDGVDSLGRPVIVVNADAMAPKVSRKSACAYMLQRLEPIVVQVSGFWPSQVYQNKHSCLVYIYIGEGIALPPCEIYAALSLLCIVSPSVSSSKGISRLSLL